MMLYENSPFEGGKGAVFCVLKNKTKNQINKSTNKQINNKKKVYLCKS